MLNLFNLKMNKVNKTLKSKIIHLRLRINHIVIHLQKTYLCNHLAQIRSVQTDLVQTKHFLLIWIKIQTTLFDPLILGMLRRNAWVLTLLEVNIFNLLQILEAMEHTKEISSFYKKKRFSPKTKNNISSIEWLSLRVDVWE